MTSAKRLSAVDSKDPHFRMVPTGELVESPTNPRKMMGDLSGLVQSIKSHGVLEPLIAREKGDKLELIAGHRRLKASREAGIRELPVVIRQMSDGEVLEAQLIENSQREDIHPMELAESYGRLQREFGHSVDHIAKQVGTSSASIYASLKLLDLCADVRKVFYRGKLEPSVALLIARLKDERLQIQAADEVTRGDRRGDPMSVRAAMEHLQKKYPLKPRGAKAQKAKRASSSGVSAEDLEVSRRLTSRAIDRIVQGVEHQRDFETSDLRLMVLALLAGDVPASVLQRRGFETVDALRAAAEKKYSSQNLRGLLLELTIARWVGDGSAGVTPEMKALAKAMEVNLRELEATIRYELEQEAKTAEAEKLFTGGKR